MEISKHPYKAFIPEGADKLIIGSIMHSLLLKPLRKTKHKVELGNDTYSNILEAAMTPWII